jgi:predicted CXXCH cytochrome family protein
MRHRILVLLGIGVLLVGVDSIVPSLLSSRATAAEVKYSGPKLCLACHKGMHPEVIEAVGRSAHQQAMWKIEDQDADHVVLGDFSGSPPFPKEKIAYVLGVGRKYQSYLDADLRVLPAEWLVAEKAWRPREAVDATRDCLGCHTTGFDPDTKKWAALGVTCEMCHGPGSGHVGSKDKLGSIVRPQTLTPAARAMICGQCHGTGQSKDGAFAYPRGYRPGDDLNTFFALSTELPADGRNSQYNQLLQSKHLAAGTTCTTCHNPHGPTGEVPSQLKLPLNDLCLSEGCHGGKLSGAQHQPEALKTVTCNTCHMPGKSHTFTAPTP